MVWEAYTVCLLLKSSLVPQARIVLGSRSPADCLAGQGIEADDDMRSLQFLHDGILLISKDSVNLGIDGSAWKDLGRQGEGPRR